VPPSPRACSSSGEDNAVVFYSANSSASNASVGTIALPAAADTYDGLSRVSTLSMRSTTSFASELSHAGLGAAAGGSVIAAASVVGVTMPLVVGVTMPLASPIVAPAACGGGRHVRADACALRASIASASSSGVNAGSSMRTCASDVRDEGRGARTYHVDADATPSANNRARSIAGA
jgi:hypothetical protein